jgi:hypothetical protein
MNSKPARFSSLQIIDYPIREAEDEERKRNEIHNEAKKRRAT